MRSSTLTIKEKKKNTHTHAAHDEVHNSKPANKETNAVCSEFTPSFWLARRFYVRGKNSLRPDHRRRRREACESSTCGKRSINPSATRGDVGGEKKKTSAWMNGTKKRGEKDRWEGGGGYSIADCLNRLTIDHTSPSRRSTVPTPSRDTPKTWALNTFFPYRVPGILHSGSFLYQ